MSEETRLTKHIHYLVRGRLNWEESLRILEEIVESEEWMQHYMIEHDLHVSASEWSPLEKRERSKLRNSGIVVESHSSTNFPSRHSNSRRSRSFLPLSTSDSELRTKKSI